MTIELLNQIFQLCIVPLMGVISLYLTKYLEAKRLEVIEKSNNELQRKYLNMLFDTVNACVIETNQTYVEGLKAENAFDKEAQKHAFQLTFDAVMKLLTSDAKKYLTVAVGDLNGYVGTLIEASVNAEKK